MEITNLFTDEKAELEGVWCPVGDGAELLIAREGNEEYQKMLNRKVQANRAVLDNNDDLARKTGEQIVNEVYAHHVIKGARGIELNGEPVTAYTPEIGLLFLKDRNVREKIRGYAQQSSLYRKNREEDAIKKS